MKMTSNDPSVKSTSQDSSHTLLKEKLQFVIATQNLDGQRRLINALANDLKSSVLDCAAAILHLSDKPFALVNPENTSSRNTSYIPSVAKSVEQKILSQSDIRRIRYRLNLGVHHQATLDQIKTVLVEESGVDIKNITNVRIMDAYTLIDLPDEMPQEIFHHLKTVEINGQKLDIRRVKPRNKKRGNRRHRSLRDPLMSIEKVSS